MMTLLNRIPHWLFALLSAFAGGFVGYLEQNESNLFVALTSWPTAKGILMCALFAGLGSLLAQAKQSWVSAAGKVFALVFAVHTLSACGAGQIFGPGSKIPKDLTADAECFAANLIEGRLDPVSVFADCKVNETQTIDDLWQFVVDAIEGDGKISHAQASAARDGMQAHRAGMARP